MNEVGSVSFVGVSIIPTALILFTGSIVLQIFLSRAKSKIPGLVLPIISFAISILIFAVFVLRMLYSGVAGAILLALSLIPLNIPTMILLLIYLLSRRKLNNDNNQEIKKMTIQDLE